MDIDSAEEIWKFFQHCMNESNLELTENNLNPYDIMYSIDLLGRKVSSESNGFIIHIYEDGSAKKNIRLNN